MSTKKIRLLVDHEIDGIPYSVNTVLEIDAAQAKTLVKAGAADDSKAAVEYALGLGATITHDAPPEPEPAVPAAADANPDSPDPAAAE